ncbi:MAG: UDP-N-acetylglucosamine 2-epimerase [Bacteroidetes bacterium]|nr:UDP-N-acetylglucosamine 2-epimerase [Bacteroidota bacterium]
MLVDIIAGDREDIIRMASILEAIQAEQQKGTRLGYRFIYTGPDVDINMEKELFSQLQINRPNVYLGIEEKDDNAVTAGVILRYDRTLANSKPDWILTAGSNTASVACAITAARIRGIQLAVVNGGVRANDTTNGRAINHILTDALAQIYFTAGRSANEALRKMGVSDEKIFFTGNSYVDNVVKHKNNYLQPQFWNELELRKGQYTIVILNNSNNIDYTETLANIISPLLRADINKPVLIQGDKILEKKIEDAGIQAQHLHVIKQTGYLQLCYLMQSADKLVTDSTEMIQMCSMFDTSMVYLGNNTDNPELNLVAVDNIAELESVLLNMKKVHSRRNSIPYLWDGKAGERIATVLKNL